MAEKKGGGKGKRIDFATIGGLVLAVGAILGGLIMEGGQLKDVAQVTAALIVLGGTLGAVLVTTPQHALKGAIGQISALIMEPASTTDDLIEQIVDFASRARKHGLVSLEGEAANIDDPFVAKAINLAIDGTDLQELRAILELEMSQYEGRREAEAKVFDAAGGYAPTIGIIGAVLGLIQVMKHLEDIREVGHGIAVAFVATVYGVALANLIFLPAAGKIRARLHEALQRQELVLEGVIGIAEGLNPKLLRRKLDGFVEKPAKTTDGRRSEAAASVAA